MVDIWLKYNVGYAQSTIMTQIENKI